MPEIPRKSPQKPWIAKPEPWHGRTTTTFYNNAPWRRFRLTILQQQPLCVHCNQKGIVTPATDIDHIQPVNPLDPFDTKQGKYGKPLDPANCQPLCRSCHNKKTAASRGIQIR